MRWCDCSRSGLLDERFPLTGRAGGICFDCFSPTILSSWDCPTPTSLWTNQKSYTPQGTKSPRELSCIKLSLLVRFGWKNTGQCFVKYLLQLVSATYGVGLGLLTSFLKTHDLLHIHSQVRDGVAAGFLNVPDLGMWGAPFFLSALPPVLAPGPGQAWPVAP